MPQITASFILSSWDRLRGSFWFLPSAMTVVAVLLSFALVQLDNWLSIEVIREVGWLYTFGPEGARAILSAVASSMITVAGLTFSITMLTLQLASSQFGPRLLRNFMRDRGNQVVLGTFVATFVYCLLVLRTVRGTEGSSFVPHISVAFGVLLALASLAVLIYFFHHVASSIRIETVLARLAAETRESIDRLYPEKPGQEPQRGPGVQPKLPNDFDTLARAVRASSGGYVERMDEETLIRVACEHDLIVRIDAPAGRFVSEGDTMLSAYPLFRISEEAVSALESAIVLGSERTPGQDLEFSIRRIVEIAQRALSAGINDPTTALYCIDRLGEALGRLARRELPSPFLFDQNGRPRVVTQVSTLEQLASPAFAAVARYGMKDADVLRRLLEVMDGVSRKAPPGAAREVANMAEAIHRQSQHELGLSFDREAMRKVESGGEAGR